MEYNQTLLPWVVRALQEEELMEHEQRLLEHKNRILEIIFQNALKSYVDSLKDCERVERNKVVEMYMISKDMAEFAVTADE